VEGVFLYTPPRVYKMNLETKKKQHKNMNSLPSPRSSKINPSLPRIFHHNSKNKESKG